jgi:hypothetical protein
MIGDRVTLIIEGLESENGHVRLADFIGQLYSLQAALRRTDSLTYGEGKPGVQFQIVELSHSSPTTIALAATEDVARGLRSADELIVALHAIQEEEGVRDWIDNEWLKNILGITGPVGKRTGEVRVFMNGKRVDFTETLDATVKTLIVPDKKYLGSVTGKLDKINIHAEANELWVYPIAGPPGVKCNFTDELREDAIKAIGRTVRVSGMLMRPSKRKWPTEIAARKISLLPDENEAPLLGSLRGIAPGAIGNASPAEFIRRLRDQWDEAV